MLFFNSYRALFASILLYFAFILPFYLPFYLFLSPFFLVLLHFPLFLFPFSYLFPQMTLADIFQVFSNIKIIGTVLMKGCNFVLLERSLSGPTSFYERSGNKFLFLWAVRYPHWRKSSNLRFCWQNRSWGRRPQCWAREHRWDRAPPSHCAAGRRPGSRPSSGPAARRTGPAGWPRRRWSRPRPGRPGSWRTPCWRRGRSTRDQRPS